MVWLFLHEFSLSSLVVWVFSVLVNCSFETLVALFGNCNREIYFLVIVSGFGWRGIQAISYDRLLLQIFRKYHNGLRSRSDGQIFFDIALKKVLL